MTAGEAGAGLVAAEDFAARRWLEERKLFDAGYTVKTVEVYQSAGRS